MLSITIAPGPPAPAPKAGVPWTFDFKTLASTSKPAVPVGSLAWDDGAPALPAWLTLNPDGTAFGTPPESGSESFQVVASAPDPDDGGQVKQGQRTFTITIGENRLEVVQISTGLGHTCALVAGGRAKCWGYNGSGQVGDGTTVNRHAPVDVMDGTGSAPLTGIASISAGGDATCALMASGEVLCWGYNGQGELGDGTTTNRALPAPVRNPGNTGNLSGVSEVDVGQFTSCVRTNAGGMLCWGWDYRGALGNDLAESGSALPVQVQGLTSGVTAISVGSHTCAVHGGAGKCWGRNDRWETGGTTLTDHAYVPRTISGLEAGVTAISAGQGNTCAIQNGAAKCLGRGGSGQIGNGAWADANVPTQVQGLLSGVTDIAAGRATICAIHGGNPVCWGDNYAIGTDTMTNHSTPQSVGGLPGVADIDIGSDVGCAMIGSGEMKCWGNNYYGALGTGDTDDYYVPEFVRAQ